jgi:hypothetical protein
MIISFHIETLRKHIWANNSVLEEGAITYILDISVKSAIFKFK